tara:strand:+ start:236 stop:373 length:138 start_codon:yes stop_codon:yes gene_type:complete
MLLIEILVKLINVSKNFSPKIDRAVYDYELDCIDGTFNKSPDSSR